MTKTLGMFLVQTLAKQLRGDVRFARDTHTRCIVTVPLPCPAAGEARGATR